MSERRARQRRNKLEGNGEVKKLEVEVESLPVKIAMADFTWEIITGKASNGTMVKLLRAIHPSGGVVVELLMDYEKTAQKMGASLAKPPIVMPGLEVVAP